MPDHADQFECLISAAKEGRFDAAIRETVLATSIARRHPLNFVVLRADDGAGLALRLHLWDARFHFGQAGFEIHDHVFDIDSFVVRGSVRQTVFEATLDPAGEWDEFAVAYKDGGSSLEARDRRLGLTITREDVFSQGDRYRLDQGVLHRLSLNGPTAATLVLTRAHKDASAVSVGPRGAIAKLETDRSTVCDANGNPLTLVKSDLNAIVNAAIERAAALS